MGADLPPKRFQPMRTAYLCLTANSTDEVERIDTMLSDGRQILMPMEETVFAFRSGMLRDRFGTSGMVLYPKPQAPERMQRLQQPGLVRRMSHEYSAHSMHYLTFAWVNRNRHLFVALLALAAACLAGACRSTPTASPAVSADTWASVDGREITRDQVEKAFRRRGDSSQTLSEEEALTAKLGLLDDLIVEDILLAKARELKIEVAESEVDASFAEAKKNIKEGDFQQELARRNLTTADMRDGLRRELLAQKLIEREVGAKIAVTDQEVTDFFDANRAQFNVPEDAYHLAQIVVTPVRDAQLVNRTGDDATTPQAAAAKVAMLMERLKEGSSFRDLALDYSEDPESTSRGGDLGLVPLSAVKQASPALRDAVLKVAPGSARVVSEGGAHTIVFVVAQEPAGQRDLSQPAVRERITEALRGRKEQLLRTAYLTAARTDAQVVNYLARRVVESQGKSAGPSPASSK